MFNCTTEGTMDVFKCSKFQKMHMLAGAMFVPVAGSRESKKSQRLLSGA